MKKYLMFSFVLFLLGLVSMLSTMGDIKNFFHAHRLLLFISSIIFSVASIYCANLSGRRESASRFVLAVLVIGNFFSLLFAFLGLFLLNVQGEVFF